MHTSYFITGTDTGVGKTYVTQLLLKKFGADGQRCAGLKPVASGATRVDGAWRNDDALQLQAAANITLPYDVINPYCFEPPIAPHLAAARADVHIDLDCIAEECARAAAQVDVLLVEGVGGWLVPLSEDSSVADLAQRLACPVILVVGMRLGCINHALLTARAIEATGLELAGWCANPMAEAMAVFEDNVATLEQRIDAPCVGVLERDAGLSFDENMKKLVLV